MQNSNVTQWDYEVVSGNGQTRHYMKFWNGPFEDGGQIWETQYSDKECLRLSEENRIAAEKSLEFQG